MEKIELTADEIKVIKQQLNGEIEVWNADDYQQKHLTSVIDKANRAVIPSFGFGISTRHKRVS